MSVVMIETIGFGMTPIYIPKDKILRIEQNGDNQHQTRLMFACGNEVREWLVNEPVAVLRYKYDNA